MPLTLATKNLPLNDAFVLDICLEKAEIPEIPSHCKALASHWSKSLHKRARRSCQAGCDAADLKAKILFFYHHFGRAFMKPEEQIEVRDYLSIQISSAVELNCTKLRCVPFGIRHDHFPFHHAIHCRISYDTIPAIFSSNRP